MNDPALPTDCSASAWYDLATYATERGFGVGIVEATRRAGSKAKNGGTLSRIGRSIERDPRVRAAILDAQRAFEDARAVSLNRARAALR